MEIILIEMRLAYLKDEWYSIEKKNGNRLLESVLLTFLEYFIKLTMKCNYNF